MLMKVELYRMFTPLLCIQYFLPIVLRIFPTLQKPIKVFLRDKWVSDNDAFLLDHSDHEKPLANLLYTRVAADDILEFCH